jgi:cyclopropane-fatty-acyl-phospholipid synthase
MGHPPFSFVLWSGETLEGAPGRPSRLRLHLRDRRLLREVLRSRDLAFGEAYVDGRLEVEGDLVQAIELAFAAANRAPRWARAVSRLLTWHSHLNPRSRARRNVHHHYDLGNDFYRLWLDERMVYTCAYFEQPGMSLEEAQVAKLEHVCRKLRLRPGERVVEAGCGWGALALHAAEHYDVRVRAYNVSSEQIRFAREEARRRGLENRVEFVEDDYRKARDACDAFVSVGMLEHVGPAHYRSLGKVVDRCLAPDGRGLLHFIGHVYPIQMSPWLNRYIFPGAYIPALSEMLPVLEPRHFEVQDVENLRRHYARTLEHWLERFEKSSEQVARRYDERFVRMWRIYLSSSIASFHEGTSTLYQVLFTRSGSRAQHRLPMSRADLHAGS